MEDNFGEYIHNIWVKKDFLSRIQKALTVKENIDQIDTIKIKNFCPLSYRIGKDICVDT